ncbi:MAG: hypothetical protein RJB47_74 [Pseudomonadota bacterium]
MEIEQQIQTIILELIQLAEAVALLCFLRIVMIVVTNRNSLTFLMFLEHSSLSDQTSCRCNLSGRVC